jgi:hypothetical protein
MTAVLLPKQTRCGYGELNAMTQELFYTSAPRGLKPGSRGFCTVMSTSGMAKNLADRLEALSGYRHVFPPNDPQTHLNPVVFSHLRITVGGKPLHVLSRISAAGLDYTQRSNKFAHHIVLDANERIAAGPAAVLAVPGFMESSWQGDPRIVPLGRKVAQASAEPGICQHWQQVTGDAGWGGVLAGAASGDGSRVAAIIFQPGTDTLALVAEALSLLPPPVRWRVTFSTYYTKLPPEVECQWRFVLAGSPEAKALERSPNVLAINLCIPLGRAPDGSLVGAARTGVVPKPAVTEIETLEPSPGKVSAPYAQPIHGIPAPQMLSALEEDAFGASLPGQGTLLPLPPRLRKQNARRPFWVPVIATTVLIGIVVGVGVFASIQFLSNRAKKEVASAAGVKKPAELKAAEEAAKSAAEAKSKPPAKVETKPPPAAQTDQPSANHDEQGADNKSPDAKDVSPSGPPEQPTSSVSDRLRRYSTPTPSNTPPAPPAPADPQDSSTTADTPSGQPIPNTTAPFDLPKSIEIRRNVQDSSLNSQDASIAIGAIGQIDSNKLRLDLLGKRSVLDGGWSFRIARAEDADGSFTIAVENPHSNLNGTPTVATVRVSEGRIDFKWESKIVAAARDRAQLLCNCILCVTYDGKNSFVALREAEKLEPIKVSSNGKSVRLKSLSTVPKETRAKLVVPEPTDPWREYHISRNSDLEIELNSDDNNMPAFKLAIDKRDQALKFTCDWTLVRASLDALQINETLVGKKKVELQTQRQVVQGELNHLPQQNLLDATKTQDLQQKRKSLQDQLGTVDKQLQALDRWKILKNVTIPFSITMEVGDDDQAKQTVVLAETASVGPPAPLGMP